MDAWQTYPFEFRGGLITNLSPLQQGTIAPGSARILRNFEVAVSGGYKRILGYEKFDSSNVPYYGAAVVQGSGQTGTTLVLASVSNTPYEGTTVTIGANTYTIASGGVSYNSSTQQATLTLTTSLLVSPADKDTVILSNFSIAPVITGLAAWDGYAVVARGTDVYKTFGTGISLISAPYLGTVTVNGAGQTGSSLVVTGLIDAPKIGDTFTIVGVDKTYVLTATPSVVAGVATLSISPALASSPVNGALLTYTSRKINASTKTRFCKYRIGSTNKIAGVNGVSYPFTYDNNIFKSVDTLTDVEGATHVCWFKNSMFYAKNDSLYFTSPFTDNDFNVANGAGVINVGGKITALRVFRDQLIIFCEQLIKRITGTTLADFSLQPITEDIGCVIGDSVQEIGGDIIFLGPDGLRLLSATDRINDFGLASLSKDIQTELTTLLKNNNDFSSLVIRSKSQYRIFGSVFAQSSESAKGIAGTQLADGKVGWSEIQGIKAYAADSDYSNTEELVIFVNNDGFIYRMEVGNTFDGTTINATFATPYVQINDPRIRKTFYKLRFYLDPEGSLAVSVNLKLDFDDVDSVQPETILLSNITSTGGTYGSVGSIYGSTVYGVKLKRIFDTATIGSGFSVSLQFTSDLVGPPFTFDAATLEFASHDRR